MEGVGKIKQVASEPRKKSNVKSTKEVNMSLLPFGIDEGLKTG